MCANLFPCQAVFALEPCDNVAPLPWLKMVGLTPRRFMPRGEAKRRKLVPAKENATATTAKFWAGPPTPLFAKTNDGESTVKLWSAKSIPVWGETIAMAAVAMTNTFVPDWMNSQETTPAGAVKAAGETGTTAGDTTSAKQEPAESKEGGRRKEKGKRRKSGGKEAGAGPGGEEAAVNRRRSVGGF